jgi:hypothetical protein
MRKTALLFVIAVYGYAANAQFTLRPQAGFERPVTKISYNNAPYFKPECQSLPQGGIRADYQFKGGFGPFLGVFTHSPLVTYKFNDPETGMTAYDASVGNLQVQLQAGLQYSTKPLSLGKTGSSSKSTAETKSETYTGCTHFSLSCCHKHSSEAQKSKPENTWTVRLQPSAGLAYVPSGKEDLEINNSGTQPVYTYNAGNIKTEFISGLAFEFAKNAKRFLSLSINYFTGLGNNETAFTSESSGKTVNTTLNSKVSGWNASLGIPISFTKSNTTKKTTTTSQKTYHSCSEYYYKRKCSSYRRI